MEPIFQSIRETTMLKTATIASIRHLLSKVPAINTKDLAGELSDHNEYKLLKDTAEETVVSFRLGSNTVRLMHAKDLDKDTKDSYNKSNRAKHAKSKIDEILDEPSMPVEVQKLLMASMMRERATKLVKAEARPCQYGKGFFETLRSDAREHYWLGMDRSQRESYRVEASRQPDPDTEEYLTIIKANWKPAWQNGRYDTDYFRRYLADQVSAKQIWELVEEDIFIVTDKHRRVVFASIERLAQLLFGRDISGLLERALDNWSFFTPLPLPESTRHVVDRYIRKLHPVLNPETASVEKLPMAKMAIAHYGCWSQKGDRNARRVQQTLDSTFMRCAAQSNSRSLFKKLCSSVFAKASEMIRFLVETLDPEYYRECLDIVSQLPEDERVKFTDQDFVSLFALGVNPYTQRHRDSNDVSGGLAGLITLGSYEGESMKLAATLINWLTGW
ncbi:hypothetical protein F5B20DRAFT_153164 [Whalleya microplaca]|nr:hypothetical protein F5B20DRAFT_153164 [Whalleya microplaca]